MQMSQFFFKVSLWQLMTFCLIATVLTPPGEAHRGPMIKIKLGHGSHKHHGGGYGSAASILAAGIAVRLFEHLKKHHGLGIGGLSAGGGHGRRMGSGNGLNIGGYTLDMGGHGNSMGGHSNGMGGYGHGMARYGNGMGYSFESHDAHLMNYGYEPMPLAWAK